MNRLLRWAVRSQFNVRARLETYEKLRAAAEDGISLKAEVSNLYDINDRRGRTTLLRHIYAEWRDALAAGQPLHEAIAGWVPNHERMVLASAERGNSLVGALNALERQMLVGQRIKSAIIKAAMFPVLYALMILGLLFFVSVQLIPELNRSLDPGQAERSAPFFMAVVNTVNAAPWAPVLLALLAVAALAGSMPFEFPGRRYLDRVFPWSYYRLMQGSGLLLTLAGLLSIGANQADAIQNIVESGSGWLRARVLPILQSLRAGHSLGTAFDETGYRFPTQKIIDDIMFYEGTSQATRAVERAADRWLSDADRETERRAAAINLMGLLGVAGFVAWSITGIGFILAGSRMFEFGAF